MKKLSVSIGIPAYNEEANIYNLLKSLLSQNRKNYILKEIIVVDDGSTDKTVEMIKRIQSSKIILKRKMKRSGKKTIVNNLFQMINSDVLIILDADIVPGNKNILDFLVLPFYSNKNIGLISGKTVPLKPINFLEKIIVFSHKMKYDLYEKLNNKKNVYLCHGRVRAFSQKFYKQFICKVHFGEDAFSYFKCLEMGFDFYYEKMAKVFFRSPQNLGDHLKQSVRYISGRKNFIQHFGSEKVNQYYFIPLSLLLKIFIYYFLKQPIYFVSYMVIIFLSKVNSSYSYTDQKWDISNTSKILKIK